MTRERLTDIDLAKGLAIFLVVVGHVVAREPPLGNEWYVALKSLIYEFHMPFFMFLSGAIFAVTWGRLEGLSAYGAFARARLLRLAPGFALFSLIIWAGKVVGGRFLHVDNAQSADVDSLVLIFTRPGASVATTLWYIYVLLELYLAFPLLLALVRGRVLAALALAAVLHALPFFVTLPDFLAIDLFCEHSLYFALGIVFIKYYKPAVAAISRTALLFYGLFALSFLSSLILPYYGAKTLIGTLSIPAIYAFVNSLRAERDRAVLLTLGEYTFSIYLMNTLVIGFTKGALLKIAPWDGANFIAFFPALLAAGVIAPILLHRHVFARIPYLARITK
jgi:peptidoglycan/LPS O-acetylase OafA/YrhL